jgi:hypothetical protein
VTRNGGADSPRSGWCGRTVRFPMMRRADTASDTEVHERWRNEAKGIDECERIGSSPSRWADPLGSDDTCGDVSGEANRRPCTRNTVVDAERVSPSRCRSMGRRGSSLAPSGSRGPQPHVRGLRPCNARVRAAVAVSVDPVRGRSTIPAIAGPMSARSRLPQYEAPRHDTYGTVRYDIRADDRLGSSGPTPSVAEVMLLRMLSALSAGRTATRWDRRPVSRPSGRRAASRCGELEVDTGPARVAGGVVLAVVTAAGLGTQLG